MGLGQIFPAQGRFGPAQPKSIGPWAGPGPNPFLALGQIFSAQTHPYSVPFSYVLFLIAEGPSNMYNSKSGSKSFDELDDLLSSESKTKKPKKSKNAGGGSMHENNARHSCDELIMTRSLYEAETSDTGSQVSSKKSLEYF